MECLRYNVVNHFGFHGGHCICATERFKRILEPGTASCAPLLQSWTRRDPPRPPGALSGLFI
jgi:hypothetical protein